MHNNPLCHSLAKAAVCPQKHIWSKSSKCVHMLRLSQHSNRILILRKNIFSISETSVVFSDDCRAKTGDWTLRTEDCLLPSKAHNPHNLTTGLVSMTAIMFSKGDRYIGSQVGAN